MQTRKNTRTYFGTSRGTFPWLKLFKYLNYVKEFLSMWGEFVSFSARIRSVFSAMFSFLLSFFLLFSSYQHNWAESSNFRQGFITAHWYSSNFKALYFKHEEQMSLGRELFESVGEVAHLELQVQASRLETVLKSRLCKRVYKWHMALIWYLSSL